MATDTHDTINFRFSRDYHKRLKEIAKSERRSKSNVIQLMLEQSIDRYDERERKQETRSEA